MRLCQRRALGMGRLFRRRGFSFSYWSAAVWFLSCSCHMVTAIDVRRICWCCCPPTCVFTVPSLTLARCLPPCGPLSVALVLPHWWVAPHPWLCCVLIGQHHPAKTRRAVSSLPGTGPTRGTSFPSRGLTLYLQQGVNPSLTQGPLFQVCSFLRYCFQALENSLGSLPCYNDNV